MRHDQGPLCLQGVALMAKPPPKKHCVCCGTDEDLPEEDWVDGKPPTLRRVRSADGEIWDLCDQCPDDPWDD